MTARKHTGSRRQDAADYRAIAKRAQVEADPRSTLIALCVVVQFRDAGSVKWTTMAAFDDHMVAAIFRDQCATNNTFNEFRCVSLKDRN
jgi:hypothetical protein